MKGRVYGIIAVVLIVLVLLTGLRTATLFRLGIENMPPKFIEFLQSKSVGFISSQSARTQQGQRSIDILLAHGIPIKKLLMPEYGSGFSLFSSTDHIKSIDAITGIPIVSLHHIQSMETMPASMVEDIDALLFDMQDTGMRHHNYLAIMVHMMQMAQQHNKVFVVFDRPNPLGYTMEGPLVDYDKKSYISAIPIPVRHGLTIGELAWYCNMHVLKHPARLVVVKMAEYDRSKAYYPLDVMVSDGHASSAWLGYSFLGLLAEIRPFHVRSQHDEFSTIMLPEEYGVSRSGWLALGRALQTVSITSEYHQYIHDGIAYAGLKIEVDDINQVSSLRVVMSVLDFCKKYGIKVSFSDCFDCTIGTSRVRDMVQGHCSAQALTKKIDEGLAHFYTTARASFMYTPLPQVCGFLGE